MSQTDTELLRRYAEEGAEDAFTAIVGRYVDLVFTAAQRQVRSPELAKEVTQSVFIRLAQNAGMVKPGAPLAAWLYLVTRRTALNALKHEGRRLAREQTAFEISAMNSPSSDWSQIEPLLDEAMEALLASDRSAVLLRYFENKSLRDVGLALGSSEDAARKRVSRAIEQMRQFFLQRGVTVSAAGLASGLSSSAIQAAPAGLGTVVSSVTLLSAGAIQPAALSTLSTIAMTTSQKTLLTAALVVAVSVGLYEARVISRQRDQLDEMQTAAASARSREERLRSDRNNLLRQGQAGPGPAESAGSGGAAAPSAVESPVAPFQQLKGWLARMPQFNIPELALLTDEEWARVAQRSPLRTEEDARLALSSARAMAKQKFGLLFTPALTAYAAANNGQMPTDVAQLAQYLDPQIDASTLGRYAMVPPGSGEALVVERPEALVDEDYDSQVKFFTPPRFQISEVSKSGESFRIGMQRFMEQNNGRKVTKAEDVLPYLPTPISAGRLDELISRLSGPQPMGGPKAGP